uniref:Uncharacterized protein LOC111107186 isoform X2 n=1 Tax=Crassostrea virginica TaxID=6565 RepID=A0A8B8B5I3_CRAVI|nr:uncharacterized protein LOC111107186 isoform X2 [Crassostrea virginica]
MEYMVLKLLLFQTVFRNLEIYCIEYDRNVENKLMKGMASLGQIFKEFNDTLNEYQSQPYGNNRKSHVVDSSCVSNESFDFFQNFNARITKGSIFPQNEMTHSKSLSGTLIRRSMDEHNAFPNGGWFACGVALGLFLSSLVFVFVWFRKSLAQRKIDNIRRETASDRKANVSSCYMDIDQYELIPIYKDPALNNRFTKPAFAEHVPQNVKSKADPETEGGLDLHRVTDTTGKEQPDEHYRSPSECTSEYHLLEKQNSTSEETAGLEEDQPYFILEENDTNSANRDVTIALDNERKVLHTEK